MLKDDLMRIRHMLDSAKEAISFAQNKTRIDLETNRMLVLSIIKSIEIPLANQIRPWNEKLKERRGGKRTSVNK